MRLLMPHFRFEPALARGALSLLCAIALVAAQWAGWQHRVAHAEGTNWLHQADAGVAGHASEHDCAAFDALALGAAAVAGAPALPPHCAVDSGVLPTIVAQPTRSSHPAFQSRAPPVLL